MQMAVTLTHLRDKKKRSYKLPQKMDHVESNFGEKAWAANNLRKSIENIVELIYPSVCSSSGLSCSLFAKYREMLQSFPQHSPQLETFANKTHYLLGNYT